jgi:hypothetical protein
MTLVLLFHKFTAARYSCVKTLRRSIRTFLTETNDIDGICNNGETDINEKIFVGKPQEKRSSRWLTEDNVKMDLRETGWEDGHWIETA